MYGSNWSQVNFINFRIIIEAIDELTTMLSVHTVMLRYVIGHFY